MDKDAKELDLNWNDPIEDNIVTLQRKLVGLKDSVSGVELSRARAKFMNTYLEIIFEYINKSLDILDEDKYREALRDLDDETT